MKSCALLPSNLPSVIDRSRFGDKFDRSMTLGKLLGNNAQLFIFISILIMTQLISFDGKDLSGKQCRVRVRWGETESSHIRKVNIAGSPVRYPQELSNCTFVADGNSLLLLNPICTWCGCSNFINFFFCVWSFYSAGEIQLHVKTRHVFVKHGCPRRQQSQTWQKSLSPTFWPRPTPRGMWCQWSVRNP